MRPPTTWEAGRLPETCFDSPIRGDGTLSTPAKVTHAAALRNIVQIVDDRILCFDPDEKDKARAFIERGFVPPGTKRYKDRRFMFDRVFAHEARQADVYEATAQPLLRGLLDGYNTTVLAYGVSSLLSPKCVKNLIRNCYRQLVVARHTQLVGRSLILESST